PCTPIITPPAIPAPVEMPQPPGVSALVEPPLPAAVSALVKTSQPIAFAHCLHRNCWPCGADRPHGRRCLRQRYAIIAEAAAIEAAERARRRIRPRTIPPGAV